MWEQLADIASQARLPALPGHRPSGCSGMGMGMGLAGSGRPLVLPAALGQPQTRHCQPGSNRTPRSSERVAVQGVSEEILTVLTLNPWLLHMCSLPGRGLRGGRGGWDWKGCSEPATRTW